MSNIECKGSIEVQQKLSPSSKGSSLSHFWSGIGDRWDQSNEGIRRIHNFGITKLPQPCNMRNAVLPWVISTFIASYYTQHGKKHTKYGKCLEGSTSHVFKIPLISSLVIFFPWWTSFLSWSPGLLPRDKLSFLASSSSLSQPQPPGMTGLWSPVSLLLYPRLSYTVFHFFVYTPFFWLVCFPKTGKF